MGYKQKILAVILSIMALHASATTEMKYDVTFDTKCHYIDIQLNCHLTQPSDTLKLHLPVWAPGYYLIIDYPKNLTDFNVRGADGAPLEWIKKGKSEWDIPVKNIDRLSVSYRVFANARSVAESRVDDSMAFIAPNGVFMYPEGEKSQPVSVRYHVPNTWKHLSTSLKKSDDGTCFSPNFDMLYDSPLLLGNHRVETFELNGKHYEMAILKPAGLDSTTFIPDVKKMITTTSQMMGDTPYQNYCFIFLDEGNGGLEHCDCQADYMSGFRFFDRTDYLTTLSFVTHEYFHLYNVKRIRPIELGPFDYEREVFTPMLWVSEGFTVYYERQILLRAGLLTQQEALNLLSDEIKPLEEAEGHRHMSLRQSSYDIWLNFFNRNENVSSTVISYYVKGPVLGLLMDIQIRSLTEGKKSLDDVMRNLYTLYYKDKGRGFTEEEFWNVCKDVVGQPLDEMRRLVDTTDEIDYNRLLAPAGLTLDSDKKIILLPKVSRQQKKIRSLLLCEE